MLREIRTIAVHTETDTYVVQLAGVLQPPDVQTSIVAVVVRPNGRCLEMYAI